MPLWKIVPVTPAEDTRWQGRPIWREVIVRADTAALARVFADAYARRGADEVGVGNETLDVRTGFDDEKLYWVMEMDPAEAAAAGGADGPPGVLRAEPSGLRGAPQL